MRPRPQPVKVICASRGIQNVDLAAKVGCSAHYLGRVFNGYVRPSKELQQRIAAALGLPEGDLFTGLDDVDDVGELLRRTRTDRGFALVIDDPAVIAKVAAIVASGEVVHDGAA